MRYWAASGRLGTDAAYDTGQMKVGRRLAIKVLNASKFALSFGEVDGDLAVAGHRAARPVAARRAGRRRRARRPPAFEAWDYTRALEVTEKFFWTFCDDYLELVKDRAYGGQGEPAAAQRPCGAADRARRRAAPARAGPALRHRGGLVVVARRLGAPGRVADRRRACRPAATPPCSTAVGEALAGVRKAKSEAKVGMRAEVPSMTIVGPAAALAHVRAAEADLRAAGKLTGILDYAEGDEVGARDVELVPVAKPTA